MADGVTGRLRWELRATWLGGVRILNRIEAEHFDVFQFRPTLSPSDLALIGYRMLTWSRPGGVPGFPPTKK